MRSARKSSTSHPSNVIESALPRMHPLELSDLSSQAGHPFVNETQAHRFRIANIQQKSVEQLLREAGPRVFDRLADFVEEVMSRHMPDKQTRTDWAVLQFEHDLRTNDSPQQIATINAWRKAAAAGAR